MPSNAPSLARGHPGTGSTRQRPHTAVLIELLEDDSPVVLAGVKEEFERLGKAGHPALRRAANGGPARIRGRARQLLLDVARRRRIRRLVRYAARPEHDLERALFLLDRHGNPAADTRAHKKVLDIFGEKVRKRIGTLAPGRPRVEALAGFLAVEIGFSGSTDDYHHPSNIYLSDTLDRRQGLPLTLSAIYAFTARRAGLQAGLVPLPGRVLLSVTDGGRRFLLDPFGGGRFLDKAHCAGYLAAHELPYREEYLSDASDTAMFLRQVGNLIHSCKLRSRRGEAHGLAQVRHVLLRP